MKRNWFFPLLISALMLFTSCAGSNEFSRLRYEVYRTFNSEKISNIQPLEREGYTLVLNETFDRVSWNERGDKDHWKIGGSNMYYIRVYKKDE